MSRSVAVVAVACIGCSDPGPAAAHNGFGAQDMIAPVQAGPITTLVVAAGVDATVDGSGVTTDANGQPWDSFDEYAVGTIYVTTLSAADAESECDATGCYFDYSSSSDPDAGDAHFAGWTHLGIVPGTALPDGGATYLWYGSPYWSANLLQVLLLPAASADESTIAFTADNWAVVVQ